MQPLHSIDPLQADGVTGPEVAETAAQGGGDRHEGLHAAVAVSVDEINSDELYSELHVHDAVALHRELRLEGDGDAGPRSPADDASQDPTTTAGTEAFVGDPMQPTPSELLRRQLELERDEQLREQSEQKERQKMEQQYQADLAAYDLARKLRLVDVLLQTFTVNSLVCPFFNPVVCTATKSLLKTITQCFWRRYPKLPPTIVPYILKFLCFPQHAASSLPPRPSLVQQSERDLRSRALARREPRPHGATRKRSRSPSAEAESSVVPPASVEQLSRANEPRSEVPQAGGEPGPSAQKRDGSRPAPPEKASADEDADGTADPTTALRRPLFYLRPPHSYSTAADTVQQLAATSRSVTSTLPDLPHVVIPSTTTRLFVRMVSDRLMDEEQMNTYFGRYGQVSCERLSVTSIHLGADGTVVDNDDPGHESANDDEAQSTTSDGDSSCDSDTSSQAEERVRRGVAAETKRSAKHSAWTRRHASVLLQDFLVVVDTPANALRCVRFAYFDKLVFVALSDPRYNCYTVSDISAVGQEPLVHLQRIMITVNTAAAESNAGSSVTGPASAADSVPSDLSASVGGPLVKGATGVAGTPRGANAASLVEVADAEALAFVPDVVIDGFPFWTTAVEIHARCSQHGRPVSIWLSIDDRSGSFTGAALVRMSTAREALEVSEGLNGMDVGEGHVLVCGILTPTLDIVTLHDGHILKQAEPLPEGFQMKVNRRLWL